MQRKKGIVFLVLILAFAACMLYIHRRVIRAWLKGEEMPKAPKWHCWVSPEKRRS